MPRPWSHCALVAALLAGGAACAQQPSCVLLRNGNVLEGRVRYVAGQYRVLGEGSELHVRPDEVATVARSIQEVYSWRRAQLTAPTADDHLELAAWCLDQQLWPQASRELLDARILAPHDARLAMLQRRLEQAALAPPSAPVAAPEPVAPEAPTADVDPELLGPLPEGALEQFTRQVQPILVNNCTAGGCHRPGGERTFQLNRDLLYGMGDQRSTHDNLTAVLAAIKQERPEESPLLAATRGPHADRSTPAFTLRHQDVQRTLEDWVRLVAAGPKPEGSPSPEPTARQRGVVQASHFDFVREQLEVDKLLKESPGGDTPAAGYRDEFDPAIFNQQGDAAKPAPPMRAASPARRGAPPESVDLGVELPGRS